MAALARLSFTDDELDRLTLQLQAVLDHAADVESLDVTGVAPTAHSMPRTNVTRPDVVRPSLDRGEVLDQAPRAERDRFWVPPVLGESP